MRPSKSAVYGSLILLCGCATQADVPTASHTRHELTETEKQRIRADLLLALKTSDALLSTVRTVVSSSGEMIVCGWVRVKSEFPDYAKYPDNRPFVITYTYGPGQLRDFRLVHFAKKKADVTPLYVRCSSVGIPL